MNRRRTKIVCTIGPASEHPDILGKMIGIGLNVARLNFSHGDYEEQQARIDIVRKLAKEQGASVAIALDTKGPEVRTGNFKKGKISLKKGDKFFLTPDEMEGTEEGCTISHKELYRWVKPEVRILINDGLIGMFVVKVEGTKIVCEVENNGDISNKKSINIPGVAVPMPFLSEKDSNDVRFGVKNKVDYIFASFTRSAADVDQIRLCAKTAGDDKVKVIAKIENHEGINNFDSILAHADGIMVARGDLGVEIPLEDVPVWQRVMINKAKFAGKIVITATQMLESMTHNPRPTRAEASDVANAVFQGTSAVMLSGESAAGKYPVESVAVMDRVALSAESSVDYWSDFKLGRCGNFNSDSEDVGMAIAHAACDLASSLKAKAILVLTRTGYTARAVSSYHPLCPIVARVSDQRVFTNLSLVWGVYPIMAEEFQDVSKNLTEAVDRGVAQGFLAMGDRVVIVAGLPVSDAGTTNFLKVHTIGSIVV